MIAINSGTFRVRVVLQCVQLQAVPVVSRFLVRCFIRLITKFYHDQTNLTTGSGSNGCAELGRDSQKDRSYFSMNLTIMSSR